MDPTPPNLEWPLSHKVPYIVWHSHFGHPFHQIFRYACHLVLTSFLRQSYHFYFVLHATSIPFLQTGVIIIYLLLTFLANAPGLFHAK